MVLYLILQQATYQQCTASSLWGIDWLFWHKFRLVVAWVFQNFEGQQALKNKYRRMSYT
jgi:hypothetical protein